MTEGSCLNKKKMTKKGFEIWNGKKSVGMGKNKCNWLAFSLVS